MREINQPKTILLLNLQTSVWSGNIITSLQQESDDYFEE